MDVPHSVQRLPGHVAFGSAVSPVEEVLLRKSFAPAVVRNFQQRAIVGEYSRVRLEDDEATVEIIWAELVLVLLF